MVSFATMQSYHNSKCTTSLVQLNNGTAKFKGSNNVQGCLRQYPHAACTMQAVSKALRQCFALIAICASPKAASSRMWGGRAGPLVLAGQHNN